MIGLPPITSALPALNTTEYNLPAVARDMRENPNSIRLVDRQPQSNRLSGRAASGIIRVRPAVQSILWMHDLFLRLPSRHSWPLSACKPAARKRHAHFGVFEMFVDGPKRAARVSKY